MPFPPPIIPAEALESTARALLQAIGCPDLAAQVTVRWNARMRSNAGTANSRTNRVTLNPRLALVVPDEVDRTLRHELAHLLAQHRAGVRRVQPHGREWRQACADLGLPGEARCHTLPLPRRRLERPHCYRCPGCGAEITRTRPMRRKVACLACCRLHARGRYDDRFRLVKVVPSLR